MLDKDLKLTEKQFNKYIALVGLVIASNNGWRRGQIHFNVLYRQHKDLANAIHGTEHDPFYVDKRLTLFLETIQQ